MQLAPANLQDHGRNNGVHLGKSNGYGEKNSVPEEGVIVTVLYMVIVHGRNDTPLKIQKEQSR